MPRLITSNLFAADVDQSVQSSARRLMTNIVTSADIIAKFLVSMTNKNMSLTAVSNIEVLLELLRTKAGELNNARIL